CLADGPRPQDRCHGNRSDANGELLLLSRGLVESDARELRIDEGAVGDQPISGGPRLTRQVVAHHAEVIERHVRELRATGALAHRPHSGRRSLETIVHLDETARVELDPGLLESNLARGWRATRRDQNVGTFERPLPCGRLHTKAHRIPGPALHELCVSPEHDVDAVLFEHGEDGRSYVRILTTEELRPKLQNCHRTTKSAERLRELHSYISAADHNQV